MPAENMKEGASAGLNELARLLRHRVAIIADHALRERDAAAHLQALRQVSLDIDRCFAELGEQIPARLAHFLERRSYDKALTWIETGEAPHEHHLHLH